MNRNITVQLDAATIQKARVVAAKQSTSLSRLIANEIERAAGRDDDYERAKEVVLGYLNRPFKLGSKAATLSRESLHER